MRAELPQDVEIFDAHTHLGLDIDGMAGDLDELLRVQRTYGITGAFVFCLDEPDRHPASAPPNDRTLAWAGRARARSFPSSGSTSARARSRRRARCLDPGARGIKLHPRAQKFLLDDERLAPVFELAADRKVPILIHGGRGLPPIADELARLMDRYEPQLIIAHAGIADLAALASHFSGRPASSSTPPSGARSTCSTCTGSSRPSRCSTPRTTRTGPAIVAVRLAPNRPDGGPRRRQLHAMLGGNARRIAAGEEALPLSPPRGPQTSPNR